MVAYGSKEHPVNLGPFSRIVAVHWGGTPRYISFPLLIQRRSVVKNYPFPAQAVGESGQTQQPVDWTVDAEGGPTPGVGPSGPSTYVTGFQYEWTSAETTPAPGYGGFGKKDSGAAWGPLKIDTLAGLPSLPDVRSIVPWSVLFFVGGFTNTVLSWWPRGEYQALAGAALPDQGIPHHESIGFQGATSATLQMRGSQFLTGPNTGGEFDLQRSPYTDTPFNVKTGTTGPIDVGTEAGIDFIFGTLSIDVSDISITHKGKTYRGIGAAVQPDGDPTAPTTPGVLWILCEKETTTS
ncbi:hypothetical protein LB543_01450 [Mesorhizobium sp. ESP7-2]|uniref:hypothetical protein n=1 Tax=Mesorhizobium sp. ESP7-2 TaxID=2876622 RepID=UPI001CC8FD5A|nr:hypothetical protein [Mesorhizobium sp. ESP7-2]MBZ9705394.1 hypothetical protein [Mesorhizobium sp. ESP7-2]